MPQLSKDEYRATEWNHKPRALRTSTYERARDEENCPPNLDYKVIEQIADGVEKMILAWSHDEDRVASYIRKSPMVDSGITSLSNTSRGLQKAIKSPLCEKSEGAGCNFRCLVPVAEGHAADILANGICNGAGMGSAISKIGGEEGKHARILQAGDMHTEKTVTDTANYGYMEASSTKNKIFPETTREAEGPQENSGRVDVTAEICSSFDRSCYLGKSSLEARSRSTEEKQVGSVSRNEPEERLEGSSASFDRSTLERSSSRQSRESRHSKDNHAQSKKSDAELPRPRNSAAAQQPLASKTPTPNFKIESKNQSDAKHAFSKVKEAASEVPRMPSTNTGTCRVGVLDALLGSVIIDDEILEKKLAGLTTMPPTPFMEGDEFKEDEKYKQYQDLQIALLECAMEYEIKTIELNIKLKSLESTPKRLDNSKSGSTEKDQTHYSKHSRELQIVESMKKQVFKLQREKGAITKEYLSLLKKERKFELQKRNLEDALIRVNRLQKELVKKDQELVDCQLMEKHTQAKLHEAESLVKASSQHSESTPGVQPAKIVTLLPSLRGWVKTVKKDHTNVPGEMKVMEGYCKPGENNHIEPLKQTSSSEKMSHSNDSAKMVENVVQSLVKEVQALQRELGKLGPQTWKSKNNSLTAWRTGLENRKGLISDGSLPLKAKRFYTR